MGDLAEDARRAERAEEDDSEGYCIHGVSPDRYCPQCDDESEGTE